MALLNQRKFTLKSLIGDFDKPKIVYSEITQGSQFILDDKEKYLVQNTAYILAGEHLNYLLKLLNSPIIEFAFRKYYTISLGGNGIRWLAQYVNNIPIPLYSENRIAKQIEQAQDEETINALIAKLYNLSKEETEYIYNFYRERN